MSTEKTSAEKFCEIASWLKRQDTEFVSNFKSMKSIIRLWKSMPEGCKERKVQPWLAKNAATYEGQKLMLAINSEFGFRYFEDAPKRYTVTLRTNTWSFRGVQHLEVRLSRYDNYEKFQWGDALIEIKDEAHAKDAAERLLASHTKNIEHDMEVNYSLKLTRMMEHSKPCTEELREALEIAGL